MRAQQRRVCAARTASALVRLAGSSQRWLGLVWLAGGTGGGRDQPSHQPSRINASEQDDSHHYLLAIRIWMMWRPSGVFSCVNSSPII